MFVRNVPSKNLLSVCGMEDRVSSKKRSARKIKSTYLVVFLSILIQCAAELKNCVEILRQLRGRAAAQLRGNVVRTYNRIPKVPDDSVEFAGNVANFRG